MAENVPQGPSEAQRAAAEDLIEQASASVEAGTAPEPEPEPDEPEKTNATVVDPTEADAEDTPEGDAETQPEPEATTEPDPAPQEGHPFTPEEEQLLRRSKATAEDVEYFRGLTVEQRNRALSPLRNAVRNTDRLYGMKPEERERAIEAERTGTTTPGHESKAGNAAPKIEPDRTKAKALAEKLGITEEAVLEIAELALDPIRQRDAAIEADRATASQQQWASQVDSAARAAHTELAKSFPKLKDQAVFAALLDEDETVGLFQAKVRRGIDVKQAMSEAVRERATVKYLPEIQSQRQQERQASKQKAIQSTAEPTGTALKRAGPKAAPTVRSLDEAHDLVANGEV